MVLKQYFIKSNSTLYKQNSDIEKIIIINLDLFCNGGNNENINMFMFSP